MAIRTFTALDLEDFVLDGLAVVRRQLGPMIDKGRWTERENLHVTLHFLGDVPDDMVHHVCGLVADVAGQFDPFDVDVRGATVQPPGGPPRMIWAGVQDPTGELAALHETLSVALASLNVRDENRQYRPHVTLARIKFARNARLLRDEAMKLIDRDFGVSHVDELAVYSSQLTPEGPAYAALARAPLGQAK